MLLLASAGISHQSESHGSEIVSESANKSI